MISSKGLFLSCKDLQWTADVFLRRHLQVMAGWHASSAQTGCNPRQCIGLVTRPGYQGFAMAVVAIAIVALPRISNAANRDSSLAG